MLAFTLDGKHALVTRDGDHRISLLAIDGAKVEDTKKYMVAGFRPYSIGISPKGTVAVLTNHGYYALFQHRQHASAVARLYQL